jgi:hypothetical protein
MIEDDWKVDVSFFHRMTGIDPNFFRQYLISKHDFGLENVTNLPSRMYTKDK